MAKKKKDQKNQKDQTDQKGQKGSIGDSQEFRVEVSAEVSPEEQRKLMIDTWVGRDELYKQLFGEPSYVTPANYAAPSPIVKTEGRDLNTINGGSADPGEPANEEQHLAVLAYGPDPMRPYWTYVTAGLCTPWMQDEPQEVSGFGCELMIKSKVDEPWAARTLRSMAYYIFQHAGTISPGVRIGLNAPIDEKNSLLRNLYVWYADEAPDCWYILPSGGFGLFCAVGITEDECRYAESVDDYGTWCLQEVLRALNIGQVSIPERASIMTDENAERLSAAKVFANNFGADMAVRQFMDAD